MATSFNPKLSQLAEDYYIKYGSPEQKKIDASVARIQVNLNTYFGGKILKIIEFGSYKRDTILPRQYDSNSDVDLMIVFNHPAIMVGPETYRQYLIDFGKQKYARSEVSKDFPTVVLELEHIKYDLIPAYEEGFSGLLPIVYHIPDTAGKWMISDPNRFNAELTKVNSANGSHIKRVIRLLKAWNAKAGYPIASFVLEQEITRIQYWFCNNLQDYFFYAINNMQAVDFGNSSATAKRQALKANAKRVKEYLDQDNLTLAVQWLAHILPM